MQPICSGRSFPHRHAWFLGAFHAVGMAVAMLAAVCLRLGWHDGLAYLAANHITLSCSWAILMVSLGTAGLYDANRWVEPGRALGAVTVAIVGGTLLTTAFLWTTSSWDVARQVLVAFALFALIAVLALALIHRLTRSLGFLKRRCLVIGTNGGARRTLDLIHRHPHAGIQVIGLVHCGSDPRVVGSRVAGYPVLGTDASLKRLVRRHHVDTFIVAAPAEVESKLLRRLRSFRYRGVALADYGSLHEELTHEISVGDINDEWLLAASMNNSRPHIRRSKRALDLVGSFAAVVVAVPLAALAAALIKLDSAGPVLYRQERLGRDGRAFTILKFRTMIAEAEGRTGPVWAADDDPRVTRVGRWMRRFRVDELPQLLNVLRGEMSLIGPRPERAIFVKDLAARIPHYMERFMVDPGISGWAQVTQSYAATIEQSRRKLQADLYYIKHMSFSTDLYILLKTLNIVLLGRERIRCVHPPEAEVTAESRHAACSG